MSKWTLYIDETGSLEKPDAVAVGGLLITDSALDKGNGAAAKRARELWHERGRSSPV